jgi:KaiC/GvpD/RAD55 family RecA-like ATPase
VVDSLRLERFALLGMSHGASISIAYAVKHPDKVSHLILYGGFARGWAKIGLPPERIEELEAVAKLMRSGWGRDDPAFRQIFTSWFMPDATAEQMQAFNEYQKVSASPETAARLYRLIGDTDVLGLLPNVSVPTIVLHARGDRLIPIRNGIQLASTIAGARFVPLESKNHVLLADETAWKELLVEYRRFLGAREEEVEAPLIGGVSSGIPAFDRLLVKGYPNKSAILVIGPSGSSKESLLYRFIQDGLVHGDVCLYVTRLSTREVLEDAEGFGIDMKNKGLLWLSRDSESKCDMNNLAGLSFNIKEILRLNSNQRIRIAFDILSSVLMTNQAETIYRFLTQLFQEAKQHDVVLLATLEETMHKPDIIASMEQVFDGAIAVAMHNDGLNRRLALQVKKMRGTPDALEMRWEVPGHKS